MDFYKKLEEDSKKSNSIVCMGIDPIESELLTMGSVHEKITNYFRQILKEIKKPPFRPACIKPNIAYFEQYGIPGLEALKTIIDEYKAEDFMVIVDAKRGDIGKTSAAYAKAIFEYWGADAVTVSPFMGSDSVEPFLEYSNKGKGVYVLLRTSNPGAKDFQDVDCGGKPLYLWIEDFISKFKNPNAGAVVGATSTSELEVILKHMKEINLKCPLLIPGIGAQGGDLETTITLLKKYSANINLHRINSSSGITFAYKKYKNLTFTKAAAAEIKRLNEAIQL